MKYRLKRDMPEYKAGAVFNKRIVSIDSEDGNTSFYLENISDFDSWFEPISPQEEVEELTEDDFIQFFDHGTQEWLSALKPNSMLKLIRIINRRGKGAKDD